MLYAWDLAGRPPLDSLANGIGVRVTDDAWERARRLASGVVDRCEQLDREIAQAAEHWRVERLGTVERNILRLAAHELLADAAPAPVVIDEAVRLARWFAGSKAPAFVNGVLDALARRLGCL